MSFVENINKKPDAPCILIAPLDWGLGHATRCIPLIHLILKNNFRVLIAAEGAIASLLSTEFPHAEVLPLQGYRIRYSQYKNSFFLKMFLQAPGIWQRIRSERKWLKDTAHKYNLVAVISDNRYGLSINGISSVFITHQLHIKTGYAMTDWLVNLVNHRYIRQFNNCWVPDCPGSDNLSGELSHPGNVTGSNVQFIGKLSRFHFKETVGIYDACILLSGPEPQRTILEKKILAQLPAKNKSVVLVRGLPMHNKNELPDLPGVTVYNHLPAKELCSILLQSKLVIARSGYSSIMDLVSLRRKAILVPTPGQTEQEYLAAYLHQRKIAMCTAQDDFSMEEACAAASTFPYVQNKFGELNEKIVEEWLYSLPAVNPFYRQ